MEEPKIALYMKNLGISREEAIALIADDANDVSVELTKSQVEVVKQMTRTTGDKDKRKTTRKPDADKRELINAMEEMLTYSDIQADNVTIINPEREIQFEFRGALYRLTLAKPRKEK